MAVAFEDARAGKWRNIIVIADEAHRSQYDLIDGLAREAQFTDSKVITIRAKLRLHRGKSLQ